MWILNVFLQDRWSSKALIAKAEALYNICNFEHSLVLFTRARVVAPDSGVASNGVSKSTKTILNKISRSDVFSFKHSRTFFDFLRREGPLSVDKFIRNENKFKVAVALKTSIAKCSVAGMKNVVESLKTETVEPSKKVKNRMREDKRFLRNLETSLEPLKTQSSQDIALR